MRRERVEGGDAGGHGERVAGERAGLVDVAGGSHALHQRPRPAVGADGEAAADHLAERGEVRGHAVAFLRAAAPEAEAGDHLVEEEQRAVPVAEPAESFEEAGPRLDEPHVSRHRLHDDAGDGGRVGVEDGLDGREVVERRQQRLGGERGGDAGGIGERERGHAGAGSGQQPVGVPVVTALELQHEVAVGGGARQTQRRHCRLGAGADEAHHLDRGHGGDDALRELRLGLGGRAEGGAARGCGAHRLDHRRVGVTEDQRAERADVVDVLVAVDIGDRRAGAGGDDHRLAAHRPVGAHGGVDAARKQAQRPRHHLVRSAVRQGLSRRGIATSGLAHDASNRSAMAASDVTSTSGRATCSGYCRSDRRTQAVRMPAAPAPPTSLGGESPT